MSSKPNGEGGRLPADLPQDKTESEVRRLAERSQIPLSSETRHDFLNVKRSQRKRRDSALTQKIADELEILAAGYGLFKPNPILSLTRYYRYAKEAGFVITMRTSSENGITGTAIFRNDLTPEDRDAALALLEHEETPRTRARKERQAELKVERQALKKEILTHGPEVDLVIDPDDQEEGHSQW